MTTTLPHNKASRHRAIKSQIRCGGASRSAAPSLATSHRSPRGFSLIEVLLAIFILGVGVISIAALFPAGIALQRASVDDSFAPTIANNAISLLRTKLKPEDFGTFQQFGVNAQRPTISGDFTWLRPGFIFSDDPATLNIDERGAIDIFSAGYGFLPLQQATEFYAAAGYTGSNPALRGIPYNRAIYGSPPRILITQSERYYPSATQNGTGLKAKPQYVWDCMFRRFQGKVLVAIFVYRVNRPGAGTEPYIVSAGPPSNGQANNPRPPLPVWIDLTDPAIQAGFCANGPWNPGGPDKNVSTVLDDPATPVVETNAVVLGVPGGVAYNPDDDRMSWQEPRQWILDQNDNVHRVLGVTRDNPAAAAQVELVRAPPAFAPGIGAFYLGGAPNFDTVSDIWYIPTTARDANGNLLTLTPVYATVKEL